METKKYETIAVFSPSTNETALKDECKRVEQIITNSGGIDIALDHWGKKEVSYRVQGGRHAIFVAFNYTADKSSTVETVSKTLRITDSVLKFQTHHLSDRRRKYQGNPKRRPSGDLGDDYGGDSDF